MKNTQWIVGLVMGCLGMNLISQQAFAASQDYFLVVDEGGSANLRQSDSLQAKIINKIPAGEVGHQDLSGESVDAGSAFRFVYFDEALPKNEGYMHASRLLFFGDNNPAFQRITLQSANKTSAKYQHQNIGVAIKIEKQTLNPKKFSCSASNPKITGCDGGFYAYDHRPYYGSDGVKMTQAYVIKQMQIELGGRTFSVPVSAFDNIFIPEFSVDEDHVLDDDVAVYYHRASERLYVFATIAQGGAGQYTVCFEFNRDGFVKRRVWHEYW